MNSLIQSLNALPLIHEKPAHRPTLVKLYHEIHKYNQSIKIPASYFRIEEKSIKQKSRIHIDFASNTFVDKIITQYIKKEATHDLIFNYHHKDTHVIVYFCLFGMDEDIIEKYKLYCRWILNWFLMCVTYSDKKCHKQIRLHLYLTPFKKELPKQRGITLSGEHANSAYTYQCVQPNKIVVFREEEWFKVLVHESFHYFQLEDFRENSLKAKQLFPLPIEIHLGEAYGEFWARILTCIYNAYYLSPQPDNKHMVMEHCETLLYIERMFSCFQAVKILRHMGLRYSEIFQSTDKNIIKRSRYKEDTNIFCYYVLTAVLFHCYDDIIAWCKQNNRSLLKFDEQNMDKFLQLVERCRDHPSLLQNCKILETFIGSLSDKDNSFELYTLRMTLLDFL